MPLLFLLAAATAGGLALQRLAVPGGMVVGAMAGAAAYSLGRGGAEVVIPGPMRTFAFVILGASIGATVTRGTFSALRDTVMPAVVAALLLIAAGIVVALVLRLLGIAPPSDILATSPGALSAVTAAAAERGSGAAEVALFHTVRIVLVLASLPVLVWLLPEP